MIHRTICATGIAVSHVAPLDEERRVRALQQLPSRIKRPDRGRSASTSPSARRNARWRRTKVACVARIVERQVIGRRVARNTDERRHFVAGYAGAVPFEPAAEGGVERAEVAGELRIGHAGTPLRRPGPALGLKQPVAGRVGVGHLGVHDPLRGLV